MEFYRQGGALSSYREHKEEQKELEKGGKVRFTE